MEDKYLPVWRRHQRYQYNQDSVTVRNRMVNGGQRVIAFREDDDGVSKECSVPHQRYERYIDPAGNVVALVVSSNRLDRDDYAYRAQKLAHKERAGWLSYDKPPAGYTPEQWVEKREQEIEKRKGLQRAKTERYEKAFRSREEMIASKTGEQLSAAIKSISSAVEGIGPAVANAIDAEVEKRPKRAKKDPVTE